MSRILPVEFFARPTLAVARDLLGATLVHESPEGCCAGIVVETEAYIGEGDPACHAVHGLTPFTAHLFGPPGTAYVYRSHGLHWCFNAVTEAEGIGCAVLVRAVEPIAGIELMRARRGDVPDRDLARGPGRLCQAFGIGPGHSGHAIVAPPLYFLAPERTPDRVLATPRVGITRGTDLPWRFVIAGSRFVSGRVPHPEQAACFAQPYNGREQRRQRAGVRS